MSNRTMTSDLWILVGVGVVLLIDLLFLPWFSLSFLGVTITQTATGGGNGWLAIIAVLFALALVGDVLASAFSPQTDLPALNGSREETRWYLACGTALFVVFRFLIDIHFSLFGYGFYLAIVLSAVLVYAARCQRTGASLADTLRGLRR